MQHSPRGRVIEPGDQLGQRGLASPGGSDEGNGFARSDAQVDVAHHGYIGVIAEGHVVESDLPFDGGEVRGARHLGHGGLTRKQRTELDDRRLSLLVAVVLLHQELNGGKETAQVQEERHQPADGERAPHRHGPTDCQQCGLAQPAHELGAGAIDGVDLGGVDVGFAVLTDDVAVVDDVVHLAVVGRDDAHAMQALRQVG